MQTNNTHTANFAGADPGRPANKSRFARRTPGRRAACRAGGRAGLATVELAICLPFIVALVFGALETCNMIYVNQAQYSAAYEGLRVAIGRTGTSALATARAQEVLTGFNVQGATVATSPGEVSSVAPGQAVTVTVTVPCAANQFTPVYFFSGRTMTAQTVMLKE